MHSKNFSIHYGKILILAVFACCLTSAHEGSIKFQVMINKLVKLGQRESLENITFDLPKTITCADLKAEILKKSYPRTYKLKFGRQRVDIFTNPPSQSTMLKIGYYSWEEPERVWQEKALTDNENIKEGAQLYAIVHNKSSEASNHITVFLDYEHTNRVIMVFIKTYYARTIECEKKTVALAKSKLLSLLKSDKNEKGIRHLSESWLSYPSELEYLGKHLGMRPFELLKNGDRISLRVSKRKKAITFFIKMVSKKENGEMVVHKKEEKRIEGVFDSSAYVRDVVYYLQKKLLWKIENQFMLSKKGEDGQLGYDYLELGRRFETYPNLDQGAIVGYVITKIDQTPLVHQSAYVEEVERYGALRLVVNKVATSDTVEGQNPRMVSLKEFPLNTKKLSDLKLKVKEFLQKQGEGSQMGHNYSDIKNRLIVCVAQPNGSIKRIDREPNQTVLSKLDMRAGDTVFTIVLSKKNPHEVSFFVKDERSQKIVLITENIDLKNELTQEYKLDQIRHKAINAFRLLDTDSRAGLPIWDPDILEKTYLIVKKGVFSLHNGDLMTIALKKDYRAITIKLHGGNHLLSLQIALHGKSRLQHVLKEVKKQLYWYDDSIEEGLFRCENDQFVLIDLDSSLEEVGILDNTILYMKKRPRERDKVHEDGKKDSGSLTGLVSDEEVESLSDESMSSMLTPIPGDDDIKDERQSEEPNQGVDTISKMNQVAPREEKLVSKDVVVSPSKLVNVQPTASDDIVSSSNLLPASLPPDEKESSSLVGAVGVLGLVGVTGILVTSNLGNYVHKRGKHEVNHKRK